MLRTRTEPLPDRVRQALEVTRDAFQSAVRSWLDAGHSLTELALFLEYRRGGFVRVRPASRETLAEFASFEVATALRRHREGTTPLFFKAHSAEIAAGRLVWITVHVDASAP